MARRTKSDAQKNSINQHESNLVQQPKTALFAMNDTVQKAVSISHHLNVALLGLIALFFFLLPDATVC